MLAQYEEFKGLTNVESGSYGKTKSATYKGKRVFVKQFTPQTEERLMAEFVVSCFISRALTGIKDAPEFPQYGLIINTERKITGFYSTATYSDPTNIADNASSTRFYGYLKATGCAVHAAVRFLLADPDSVPNHGWDDEEDLISFIDVGLAFYKELSLEDGEQGKLPERDIFEINKMNLMQWLFVSVKNAESFSPFHAFSPNPNKLLPKSDADKNTLRAFYEKYLNALTLLTNSTEKTLTTLVEELPAEIKVAANKTMTRLQQRLTGINLMIGELVIEKLIDEALVQLTALSEPVNVFFDNRTILAGAAKAAAPQSRLALKENVDPQMNVSRQMFSALRFSHKGP